MPRHRKEHRDRESLGELLADARAGVVLMCAAALLLFECENHWYADWDGFRSHL